MCFVFIFVADPKIFTYNSYKNMLHAKSCSLQEDDKIQKYLISQWEFPCMSNQKISLRAHHDLARPVDSATMSNSSEAKLQKTCPGQGPFLSPEHRARRSMAALSMLKGCRQWRALPPGLLISQGHLNTWHPLSLLNPRIRPIVQKDFHGGCA